MTRDAATSPGPKKALTPRQKLHQYYGTHSTLTTTHNRPISHTLGASEQARIALHMMRAAKHAKMTHGTPQRAKKKTRSWGFYIRIFIDVVVRQGVHS